MSFSVVNVSDFRPLKGKVFVTSLEHGDTITKAGLIITDDNMTNRGIRARWGQVWAIGDDVQDIEVGQWILIEHGRWTQKIAMDVNGEIVNVWSVEYPASVHLVSDEEPKGSSALADSALTFATRKRDW